MNKEKSERLKAVASLIKAGKLRFPVRGRPTFCDRMYAMYGVIANGGSAKLEFDTEGEAKEFCKLAKRSLKRLGL